MNAFLDNLKQKWRNTWLYEELEFVHELSLLDRINVNFLTADSERIAISRLKLAQITYLDLQCVLGSAQHMYHNNRSLLERQTGSGTIKALIDLTHRLNLIVESMELLIKLFGFDHGGVAPAEFYVVNELQNAGNMLKFVEALAKHFCPIEMDRHNVFYAFLDGVQYMLMKSVDRTMRWCIRLESKETKRMLTDGWGDWKRGMCHI